MSYSIYNQPKELFKISEAAIFEVADFHIMLYPKKDSVVIFPIHEKDRFKKMAPDFGFLHSIESMLQDIRATLKKIRKKNALPQSKGIQLLKKPKNRIGSQIIAKVQLIPKGWTTQCENKKLRKAPLFEFAMQPFLIFEMDVQTYAIFAKSVTQTIRQHLRNKR